MLIIVEIKQRNLGEENVINVISKKKIRTIFLFKSIDFRFIVDALFFQIYCNRFAFSFFYN